MSLQYNLLEKSIILSPVVDLTVAECSMRQWMKGFSNERFMKACKNCGREHSAYFTLLCVTLWSKVPLKNIYIFFTFAIICINPNNKTTDLKLNIYIYIFLRDACWLVYIWSCHITLFVWTLRRDIFYWKFWMVPCNIVLSLKLMFFRYLILMILE